MAGRVLHPRLRSWPSWKRAWLWLIDWLSWCVTLAALDGNQSCRVAGKAVHGNVSYWKSYYLFTIEATVYCRSQVLEKPYKWQADARNIMGAARRTLLNEHTGTRYKNTFLLQCLLCSLLTKFTLSQLAREKYLKSPDHCSWSQQKGWRGAMR